MKKIAFTIAAALFAAQSCNMKQSVDFIGHNGVVYTVDSSFSVVEAFAIKDGLFVETGSNEEILSKYKSKNTCDFNGNAVYPGFNDTHCHTYLTGIDLISVDLRNASSFEQILERLGDIRLFRRSGRFDSRHFGEIHFFHQAVHPTFADGYAKITGKTKFDFTAAQALTGFGVDLQDFLPDALIFLFSGRWLPVYVAVIGAAVVVEYPAKNGDTVLAGKRPDSF